MDSVYQPEAWHDLYVMLGGAAAALTGLFFVALTLQLDEIKRNLPPRRRGRNNFIALALVILMAALELMPQRQKYFGMEVIAVSAVALYLPTTTLVRFGQRLSKGAFVLVVVAIAGLISCVAGGGLLLGASRGEVALAGMFLVDWETS